MKWRLVVVTVATFFMAQGLATACEYVDSLLEDSSAASALRNEIEQFRQVDVNPLSFKNQGVDAVSLTCLACHGGNLVSGWSIRLAHGPKDAAAPHRIGTNYVSYAMKRGNLQDPETLDSRIVLVNGRVGCLSCHDPFNPYDKHLVIANDGSRLCLSCHNV